MTRLGFCAVAGLAVSLAGCATGPANPDADPFEPFNRQMYAFNDGLDRAVLEPAAKGYRAVTNEPVRQGVSNFLGNLREPVTFANELLQGRPVAAAGTFGRFVINTTVGIAGVFNPAEAVGIERTREDFGQTLGVWGVAPGPYLVLPLISSTSPRDLGGSAVDVFLNPINYAEFDGDDAFNISARVLGVLAGRESAIETIDSVRETQLDPYTTLRRFHIQNRDRQIGREWPPQEQQEDAEDVPDYELEF
jgi:phospholipid-binding lipoprotein MlaA